LLISSDLQEILGMSDRVLVMRAGRIAAQFARNEATEERIIAAALGADRDDGGQE
jgi:ribose transport system ATP-binding protein